MVAYRVKKTAKMGVGTFARESNPASRLDYIQYKRAIYKRQEGKNIHSSHTHSDVSQEKKPQCNQQRRPKEAARRDRRHTHPSKANSEPKKSTANEGDRRGAKRGKTHSQAKHSHGGTALGGLDRKR